MPKGAVAYLNENRWAQASREAGAEPLGRLNEPNLPADRASIYSAGRARAGDGQAVDQAANATMKLFGKGTGELDHHRGAVPDGVGPYTLNQVKAAFWRTCGPARTFLPPAYIVALLDPPEEPLSLAL